MSTVDSDDTVTVERPPLNGATLLALWPVYARGGSEPAYFYAVVDLGPVGAVDRFGVVHVVRPADPTWSHALLYTGDRVYAMREWRRYGVAAESAQAARREHG